jgi:hypothetical protein
MKNKYAVLYSKTNNIGDDIQTISESEFLCNQVNVNYFPLFHGNKSIIKNSYYNIYTKETINLVAEKEKNVIELTGYKY